VRNDNPFSEENVTTIESPPAIPDQIWIKVLRRPQDGRYEQGADE